MKLTFVDAQAVFNKRQAEVAFYEAFFSAVAKWATDLPAITQRRSRH